MSTRRKFLALVGAAPAVAKEAASAAMGLSGPIGPISAMAGSNVAMHPGYPISADDGSWIQKALDRLNSEKGRAEIARDARGMARMLDPDLAALRSMSPSVAYRIQRSRVEEEMLAARKEHLLADLAEFTRRKML